MLRISPNDLFQLPAADRNRQKVAGSQANRLDDLPRLVVLRDHHYLDFRRELQQMFQRLQRVPAAVQCEQNQVGS